jgi:hypothetical protein
MDQIRRRIYPLDTENGNLGRSVAKSMIHLHALEQKATFDAIRGRNYHTLWEREGQPAD